MAPTILVAESDATTLELIATVLTRDGFRVLPTGSADSALAQLREHRPELLMVAEDLLGAGAELCKASKSQSPAGQVIVMSAAQNAGALKANVGCDAVLPLPFRYGVLKELLSGLGLMSAAPATAAPAGEQSFSFSVPIPEPVGIDLAQLVPAPPDADGGLSVAPMSPPPAAPSGESWAVSPIPIPLAPMGGAPVPVMPPASPEPAPAPAELQELMLDDIAASPAPAAAAPAAAVAPAPAPVMRAPMFAPPAAAPATPVVTPSAAAAPAAARAPGAAPGVVAPAAAPARAPEPMKPTPSGALPPSLPRYGDLGAMPMPRIVFELYLATFTGVIALTRQGLKRAVYLRGGLPVRVDSDRVEESLGRLLVQHGRITEEQYAQALEHAGNKQLSDGEALVQLGMISSSELLDALRELTEHRLANTFAWRDGTYKIEPDASFADKSLLSEVHPLRAIWRGVREHYDLASLMTYFAALRGRFAVATDLFSVHFDTLGSFLRNLDMATLLDGKTTFEAALRSDDSRAMEIAQALYVLLVCDMVRPSAKPGNAAVLPRKAEAQKAATAPADYREVTRICDEVAREYIRVKESDYFEALRIEFDTPAADVDAAYDNVVRPFLPESLPAGLPDDVIKRAKEICEILARAKSVARDPELKERYIAVQRQKFAVDEAASAPQKAAGGVPGAPRLASVDLDEDAEKVREQRVVSEKAYAEGVRYLKSGNPNMAKQKFEIAIRLNEREPLYRLALAQAFMALAPIDNRARRQAVACLQQALQLDPSSVEANFEMAKIIAGAGQADAAKTHLQRVLQRSPEHREARALMKKLGG